MKCERAQERILDLDPIDAEVSEHLSGCNTCACFLGLQRSIDEQLARAYTAPPVTSVFRQDIRTRIQAEKWRYRSSVLSAFIAPAASLATSGYVPSCFGRWLPFYLELRSSLVWSATPDRLSSYG